MKIINYIFLFLSLSLIAATTALQYSHDSKVHHCADTCGDQQNEADECALCWFSAHQISSELQFSAILFEPNTHNIIIQFKRMPKAFAIDLLVLQKGNKDPPGLNYLR